MAISRALPHRLGKIAVHNAEHFAGLLILALSVCATKQGPVRGNGRIRETPQLEAGGFVRHGPEC